MKAGLSGFKTTATRAIDARGEADRPRGPQAGGQGPGGHVEVTAQAPVLQTETATVGEVLSASTVESLP